jgi:LPS sulfotransferase NodH
MQNFIILFDHRCGSTVIREALDSHSSLKVLDEIFCWTCDDMNNIREYYAQNLQIEKKIDINFDITPIIEKIFQDYNGFKILRDQIHKNNPAWKYLRNNSKQIFLYRKNKVKQFISFTRCYRSKIWHVRHNESKQPEDKIYVDIEEMALFIENSYKQEKFFKNFFKDFISISYEDIQNDIHDVLYKIQNFLEIQPENLKINLQKINTKPLSEVVSNYNELKNWCSKTKYNWMIK